MIDASGCTWFIDTRSGHTLDDTLHVATYQNEITFTFDNGDICTFVPTTRDDMDATTHHYAMINGVMCVLHAVDQARPPMDIGDIRGWSYREVVGQIEAWARANGGEV